jgi:hypothetical protein
MAVVAASRSGNAEIDMNSSTAAKDIQYVKVRASSPVANEWGIAPDMSGEVLCRYKSKIAGADRLDVRFPQDRIIWGAPVAAFEFLGENEFPVVKSALADTPSKR